MANYGLCGGDDIKAKEVSVFTPQCTNLLIGVVLSLMLKAISYFLSIETAWQAAPSPLPVNPRCSSVVALMLILP